MSALALEQRTGRYGLKEVVRGEFIKLWSIRSTYWTLLIAVFGSLGVTGIACWSATHNPGGPGFDPTNQSLAGISIALLAMGVLGVMAATGEYANGTIRSTLGAAPRRNLLLTAKALVVGGVALVVGEVITFCCFGLGQLVLGTAAGHSGTFQGPNGPQSFPGVTTASLMQPGVFRAVALSGVFLALLALLGLGLGVIIRHTAGAIVSYVGVTLLAAVLLHQIPRQPERWTPVIMLVQSVASVVPQDGQLSAPASMLFMAIYAAVALGVASVMISRRDA